MSLYSTMPHHSPFFILYLICLVSVVHVLSCMSINVKPESNSFYPNTYLTNKANSDSDSLRGQFSEIWTSFKKEVLRYGSKKCHLKCTVGTESIQTPLNVSLFVSLQPFAPHLDRKKTEM